MEGPQTDQPRARETHRRADPRVEPVPQLARKLGVVPLDVQKHQGAMQLLRAQLIEELCKEWTMDELGLHIKLRGLLDAVARGSVLLNSPPCSE